MKRNESNTRMKSSKQMIPPASSLARSDASANRSAEPSSKIPLKVALVEDQPKVRESWTRLIDSFPSNSHALTALVSRLQEGAVNEEDRALLTDEDWEILRAMNLSPEKIDAARRVFGPQQNANALRRRAEALLGIGATSPARGFSESSWESRLTS